MKDKVWVTRPVVGHWRKVEDGLPSEKGMYLVWAKTDLEHEEAFLEQWDEGWALETHYKWKVTHWAKLRKPSAGGDR